MLIQHHHYGPELTAPHPSPAFSLLLEFPPYASMAERVWVSGGVNKRHTTASSVQHHPVLAVITPPFRTRAIWAASHPEITCPSQPLSLPAAP
eukprot:COSAG01_NODE_542_length_15693_cov_13.246253_18_plen_93_part_00